MKGNFSDFCRPFLWFQAWLIALLLWGTTASAQDADRPVLRVPWVNSPAFASVKEDGEPVSFAADVSRSVAAIAGFDVEFVEFENPAAVRQALQEGTADMLGFAGRWVDTSGTLLFSEPVSETTLNLYVKKNFEGQSSFEDFHGQRIGTLRSQRANIPSAPSGASFVNYESAKDLFSALLFNEVDGVVLLSPLAEQTLRRTGLQAVIVPTFPEITRYEQSVVVRPEFSELLPIINQAILDLKSRGDLQALAQRWYMVPPTGMPDTLTVGVVHFPPYTIVSEDGSVDGFGVDLLQELAARADLPLAFKPVLLDSWRQGPRVGEFDLLPVRSITQVEQQFFDFTVPIQSIEYATFVRPEDADQPLELSDGAIGMLSSSVLVDEISAELGVELALFPDTEASVAALRNGDIKALVYPINTFNDFVAESGEEDRFARLSQPVFRNDLGITLRPGLGDLKPRLDAVLRGYIGTESYRTLSSKWFDPPEFWTEERLDLLLYVLGALAAGVAILIFWMNLRARRISDELRKRTEEANGRLNAVLTSASQAVFGFGTNGGLAIANPAGRALIGSSDTSISLAWPDTAAFIDPVTQERCNIVKDGLPHVVNEAPVQGKLCLFKTREDQPARFVRVTSEEVNAPGTGLKSLLIVEDDHENELNRQKLSRSEKLSSLGLLTGGLAHDFNNVLGSVLLNAQLGAMKKDNPSKALFERIVDAVQFGKRLTAQLLAFSSNTPKAPVAVDVATSLNNFEDLARSAIPESIKLHISPLPEPCFVFCDTGELENALLNLAINARDAIESASIGDTITVQVRLYEDDRLSGGNSKRAPIVEISVSDNGPGMSEEVRAHAVDPFFTTKKDGQGTGLGLSMVDGFVRRSGGDMSLYSEPGSGTTVRLYLPRVDDDGALRLSSGHDIPLGHGERILLVEDQKALREPMAEVITQLGYTVDPVASGSDALAKLIQGESYDLILSDIVMPGGVSGIDLLRHVAEKYPDLPVQLMTGYAELSQQPSEHLDVHILQKPIPLAELAEAIATRLDRTHGATSDESL